MNLWSFFSQFLLVYVGLTVIIYFMSDFAIFPVPKASYTDTAQIFKLTTQDGKKISALYLKNPLAKYTILYSHGNGEDLGSLLPILQQYPRHGFSIFAYDYHGYGTSEGSPSENNTYQDINAAYQYLTEDQKIPAQQIILYGRSLGSGPAVDLATRVPIAGIILESPLLTAFRVITRIPLLPVDKYRNDKKISKIKRPIFIMHSKKDETIAFGQGYQLYELANPPKKFWEIPETTHNDIIEISGEKYWENLQAFVDSLDSARDSAEERSQPATSDVKVN